MKPLNNFIYCSVYIALLCVFITFLVSLTLCISFTACMITGLYSPDHELLRNTTYICITSFITLVSQDIYYNREIKL